MPPSLTTLYAPTPTTSTLSTPKYPWDSCLTTITVLAPTAHHIADSTLTPTTIIFRCPATVTVNPTDTQLDKPVIIKFATPPSSLQPPSTPHIISEDEGYNGKYEPQWAWPLAAVLSTIFILALLYVCYRCWRGRNWRGEGRILGSRLTNRDTFTRRPAAVGRRGGIELTRVGRQLEETMDVGTVTVAGNGGDGASGGDREKDAETRYAEAGWEEQKVRGGGSGDLDERDVTEYFEGMEGRF